MRLLTAMLCDHATVREGLLHVLGGGVTTLTRPEMPSPFEVDLALTVAMDIDELRRDHEMIVRINLIDDKGDNQVLAINAQIGTSPEVADHPTGIVEAETPVVNVPLVVPTKQLVMGQEGLHRLDIELDGAVDTSLWFRVYARPDLFQDVPIVVQGEDAKN